MSESFTFRIYDAADRADTVNWISAWEDWPLREIFAHPNYVTLYADGLNSRALCAVWRSAAGSVLYPFVLRDVRAEPWCRKNVPPLTDIVTPYGYGGAFAWDVQDRPVLARAFWRAFDRWAMENNVVTEFIRFSLFTENVLPYPGERVFNRQNVVRNLKLSDETMWMDFKHKVRKNVTRARKSGVKIESDASMQGFEDFLRIYRHTLDRWNAAEDNYFSEEYFEELTSGLPGQFIFFHATLQNIVISTELVLISAKNVYSFLGGTDDAYFDVRPNDLLKYEIIRWAKANQMDHYVFGGGFRAEDGILKYKKAFAPNGILPFYVGTRVFNPSWYEQLIQDRKKMDPSWAPEKNFFPLYRC